MLVSLVGTRIQRILPEISGFLATRRQNDMGLDLADVAHFVADQANLPMTFGVALWRESEDTDGERKSSIIDVGVGLRDRGAANRFRSEEALTRIRPILGRVADSAGRILGCSFGLRYFSDWHCSGLKHSSAAETAGSAVFMISGRTAALVASMHEQLQVVMEVSDLEGEPEVDAGLEALRPIWCLLQLSLAATHDEKEHRRAELMGRLTGAQRRVAELLLSGLHEREVAARMERSAFTVHDHVKAIYRAWEVASRGEFMAKWSGGYTKPGRSAHQSHTTRFDLDRAP